MQTEKTFDNVIREVDKNTKPRPSEELLIVERKQKEIKVFQKSSFFKSVFGGRLSYYIVANNSDASNFSEGKVRAIVRDFIGNRSIDVEITYETSCPRGKEKEVLYALCEGNLQPKDELEHRIKQYVAEYSRLDGRQFIDNYFSELSRLKDVIVSGVQRETGLLFDLRIILAGEKELEPFLIQPTSFTVRVQDCDDALDLNIHTELIVDEANKVKAILKAGREFELANLVKDAIRDYLRKNISIQQFYSYLTTSVRNKILEHVNNLLSSYGRKINFLTLSSDTEISSRDRFQEITCSIQCAIHEPDFQSFDIKNTLQMELEDISKYRIAQSPDLLSWAKEKLEPVIKTALFQKSYVDVLLKFNEIADSIKEKIKSAAKEIGYSVEQIVSTPELEPLELIKDFDLELEEAFTLKDVKVEVKLGIIPTLHIPDLKAIEKDLTPNIKLKDSIKKHIVIIVRRFLNQVEPERFYMRFSDPDAQLGESQSIEEELGRNIALALEDRFKAQVSNVVIKTLDTDLKRCYEDLFKEIGDFELEFNSFKDGKPVYLKGDFQICGVDQFSWYTFQARQPVLVDIKECIKKSIHAKLSNLPSETLSFNNIETQTRLEHLVTQVATESVVKQFGLKIEVNNVSRRLTELETLKSQAEQSVEALRVKKISTIAAAREIELTSQLSIAQISSDASVEELEKLLEQRKEIIALEGSEDELEELNEKIDKLQAKSPSGSIEDAEDLLKSMRLTESDASQLLGFSNQMKALESGDSSVYDQAETTTNANTAKANSNTETEIIPNTASNDTDYWDVESTEVSSE